MEEDRSYIKRRAEKGMEVFAEPHSETCVICAAVFEGPATAGGVGLEDKGGTFYAWVCASCNRLAGG